jgi:hypothetical protein
MVKPYAARLSPTPQAMWLTLGWHEGGKDFRRREPAGGYASTVKGLEKGLP